MNKQPHHLAETIAEVINLKTLEIYRRTKSYIDEAKRIDQVLAEVGAEILEAISRVPEPDEYEIWLRERKAENKEKCPAPEKNTQEAPIDPGAEPMTQNVRTPIDGGDPDNSPVQFVTGKGAEPPEIGELVPCNTKESNEHPDADDQPQAATPGVDAVPDAAASQAGTSTKEQSFADKLRDWKESEGLSNMDIQRLSGVSNVSVLNILNGTTKNPTEATREKLLAAISNYKKKEPEPARVNGSGYEPSKYIQKNLRSWMKRHGFNKRQAARRLQINETAVGLLQVPGSLPHPNVLGQLSKHIPAIKREHGSLMKASINRGY